MFERYTEHARRVIFFARYEASQFGKDYIEPEHLLLGVLRESATMKELLGGFGTCEKIRREVESGNPGQMGVSTSVDLPLSDSSKRVLAYGAEEAERLAHRGINELHLILGILRESDSLAAQLLAKHALDVNEVRRQAGQLAMTSGTFRVQGAAIHSASSQSRLSTIEIVIGLSREEADKLHQPLDAEHLLLGLLRHAESPAAKLLVESGLTLEVVRAKLASS